VEGQGLRDRATDFDAANAVIFGASFDTPAENKAFASAQEFPYLLLSDVDHTVGQLYGVVRAGDDQYNAFPRRLSFLIDPEGVIRRIYNVTDVAGHAGDVLDDIAGYTTQV
jgi:peroxiredoxin Q/BCP